MKHLFSKADIFNVSEYQKDQFKKAFQEVSNAELDRDTPGVMARLVEQFSSNVPVLRDDVCIYLNLRSGTLVPPS